MERIGRLALLGAGKMGDTLLAALLERGVVARGEVVATARQAERLGRFAERHQVATSADNRAAVAGADVVLLAVKPQTVPEVLAEIGPGLDRRQLVVSIAAGVTTTAVEARIAAGVPVVRAMPNTPSRVGRGMTAVCAGSSATPAHLATAVRIFAAVGRCLVLDERHFDAVTGLSASGPAFLYVVIEALAEGGVKAGLPRDVATVLAAQTCLGAGHMVLETGHHPALLKDEVTTPAGCTVDGILQLEEGGLRVTLIKAVVEAARRAGQLAG